MNLDRPLAANLTVLEARDAYLRENGFSLETYDAPGSYVTALGVTFWRPLTPTAKWAIRLHDLHHAVTGYGTDILGEAEVSAWELRRGLRGLGLYVGGIVTSAVIIGMCLAPRRTWRAFRDAGQGPTLFTAGWKYEELLGLSLGELRAKLGVEARGVATAPRRLHPGSGGRASVPI